MFLGIVSSREESEALAKQLNKNQEHTTRI